MTLKDFLSSILRLQLHFPEEPIRPIYAIWQKICERNDGYLCVYRISADI